MAGNIGACIYTFSPINQTAAYLLVPYLAWVSFATALTYKIWCDNPAKKADWYENTATKHVTIKLEWVCTDMVMGQKYTGHECYLSSLAKDTDKSNAN